MQATSHSSHAPTYEKHNHIGRQLAKIVSEGRSDSQVIVVSAAAILTDIGLICQLISRLFEYSYYITNSEVSARLASTEVKNGHACCYLNF